MSATTRNHQRPTEPRLEKKLPKDVFRLAPTASRIPISRVLSVTDTNMWW